MRYVYVGSTYPLFLGIYMMNRGEKVTFIYTRENYRELFDVLGTEAVKIDARLTFTDLFHPLKIRKKIRTFNQVVGKNEFVFTHFQYADALFLVLFNRLKNSKSIYFDLEPIASNPYNLSKIFVAHRSFIRVVISRLLYKWLYNTHLKIQFYNNRFYLALDRKKLSKFGFLTEKLNVSNEEIAGMAARSVSLPIAPVNNLYIVGSEFQTGNIVFENASILKLWNFLIEFDIPIKPHPTGYKYPSTSQTITASIPTELLFNYINGAIISICSTSLISASHYYENTFVKVVCIAELVQWLDDDTKLDQVKRIKMRGKENILFPDTFDALKLILRP